MTFAKNTASAVPLHAVPAKQAAAWLKGQPRLLAASGFAGAAGDLRAIPAKSGIGGWVLGLGAGHDAFALAAFAEKLPAGNYALGDVPDFCGGTQAALAWALGGYHFGRYRKTRRALPKLVLPPGVDGAAVMNIAHHVFLARDLVNTPANDMGPQELEDAARALARRHGAKISIITGKALAKNYPLIAAVGMGSVRAPRLIDITWGSGPLVTLVGKGVCFDSGGYDLKPSSAMLTMKKDMGGAAVALAVAGMAMAAKLKLRLRVLIPAVENSVSGNAFRPGDVFTSRKGLTVEIGNTDAEGRLVLADALTDADAQTPELLIDIATLTGAARAATGMELPPFFTDDEKLAADLSAASMAVHDPLWRLPLWRGYEHAIVGKIADLNNNPSTGLGGAITAALFLNRFVEKSQSWVHLDIPAWNDRARPGRPVGGEANGARAVFALLQARYSPLARSATKGEVAVAGQAKPVKPAKAGGGR